MTRDADDDRVGGHVVSRGAPTRRYPPLPPLWLEAPWAERMARRAGAPGLPSWAQLEREAAVLTASGLMHPTRTPADPHWSEDFRCTASILATTQLVKRSAERRGLPPEGVDAVVNHVALSLYHVAMWRRYGRRVYLIDDGTFDLLARTELPRIPSDLLRLPAPSFYLVLPRGAFTVPAHDGTRHDVLGAVVSAEGGLDATGSPRAIRAWANAVSAGHVPRHPSDENGPLLDATFLESAMDVRPDRTVAAMGAAITEQAPELCASLADDAAVRLATVGKVILGFCLYLMSEHPALEPVPPTPRTDASRVRNPAKRRRIEERNARVSRLGYVYVGHSGDRLPGGDAARDRPGGGGTDAGAGAESGSGRRLTRQVWVSGYFRDQGVGEGRRERRLVWVRPHLKGPDYAEGLRLTGGYVQPARRVAAAPDASS